jgi:hypothetical protein
MELEIMLYDADPLYPADHFLGAALSNNAKIRSVHSVHVDPTIDRGLAGAVLMVAQPKIQPEDLARRWGIGLNQAKQMILKMMQCGICSVLHPSLARHYLTNDRMFRYKRLPNELFSDTLLSKMKSRLGSKYAQVYGARNGWTRAFGMKAKSNAHETLLLLFQCEGVPPVMIVDGAKEQILGEFKKKAHQADCHLKQLELYTPWANAAEGAIRELKCGYGCKMVRSKAPKVYGKIA